MDDAVVDQMLGQSHGLLGTSERDAVDAVRHKRDIGDVPEHGCDQRGAFGRSERGKGRRLAVPRQHVVGARRALGGIWVRGGQQQQALAGGIHRELREQGKRSFVDPFQVVDGDGHRVRVADACEPGAEVHLQTPPSFGWIGQ